ncbi:hypothetical protein HPB50_005703 [Hyalomma asiaticum]|uniref:Uncharacterized protein n=1 Tax=Hyalomma asiaticum TaxID=266040 RepID=A0ACB7RUE3_HYAAI|nr:hypothetical protein HPB50_005703 [Hyalomma asiaticum]
MVPPAQLRAIIRRRAASKSQKDESGGKARKRNSKQSASDAAATSSSSRTAACTPNKRKGLAGGDFTNIKNRLCSRFGAASNQSNSAANSESSDALVESVEDAGDPKPTSYTPLESQVVAIKQRHPNTVLLVECGYRFRFFGEDAEAAQPTTGEVLYDTFEESTSSCELEQRLESLQPVEIVLSEKCHSMLEKTVGNFMGSSREGVRLERLPPDYFKLSPSLDALTTFYSGSKDSSGIAQLTAIPPVIICCVGSLLEYLKTFKLEEILRDVRQVPCYIETLQLFNFTPMSSGCRKLDLTAATLRRLDVFRNSSDGSVKGSLFGHLDHTLTPFGRRLLFSWIGQPLADLELIKERQEAVSNILSLGAKSLPELRKFLSRMPDVQRGLCAILHKKASIQLTDLCITSTALKNCFVSIAKFLRDVDSHLECLDLNSAKRNDMATLFKDLSDYPDLLKCHEDVLSIEEKLTSLRKDIAVQLGVAKFDYKSVNGLPYLVEVAVQKTSMIPRDWFKISSTKAVSRYRPPVVERLYKDLCVAKEMALMESRKIRNCHCRKLSTRYTDYQQAVKNIATVDCFLSLAETASQAGYCRPQMLPKDPATIRIVQGRHPVLELSCGQQQYVSNDTDLNETVRCCIITGPNMGGKSSYMRQVALIVIMAHLGSYVPAESAAISLIDGVYVRMGAEDDITRWRSTFLSEMLEATEILDKSTNHSLVIVDELGRGTATHDGTAIAWATLRHIVEEAVSLVSLFYLQKRCLALFVTHYPPVTQMKNLHPNNVINCHTAFDVDHEEAVTFLYSLQPGAAEKSYGLNVARLAKIPELVIARAREKAMELQEAMKAKEKLQLETCRSVISECPG